MTTKVTIPSAGMGTTDGTVAKWLKTEGDAVRRGEIIAEIETAKAIEEVLSPATGVLTKILIPVGQAASVHAEIAVIEESE